MPKHHELRPTELAMRAVLLIDRDRIKRPALTYTEHLMLEFGVNRATGYRYVAMACDVLALTLPRVDSAESQARRAQTYRLAGRKQGGHRVKRHKGPAPGWSQFGGLHGSAR